MEDMAKGSVDYAIEEVQNLKRSAKGIEVKNTLDDCLFHLRRAKECLDDGLKNPKEWVQDSEETMRMFLAMIPFLLLMRDQSLSKQQSYNRLSSNNFSPASPPGP